MAKLTVIILSLLVLAAFCKEARAMAEGKKKPAAPATREAGPEVKSEEAQPEGVRPTGGLTPRPPTARPSRARERAAGEITQVEGKVMYIREGEIVIQDSKNEEFIHTLKLDKSTEIISEDGVTVEPSQIEVEDSLQANFVEEFAQKVARQIVVLSE